MMLVEFKVQCLKVYYYHGNKYTILLFYSIFRRVSRNFTLLKYVKSQRSYGFLITKELIFGFQSLDLKLHFSASLSNLSKFFAKMESPLDSFFAPLSNLIFTKFSFPHFAMRVECTGMMNPLSRAWRLISIWTLRKPRSVFEIPLVAGTHPGKCQSIPPLKYQTYQLAVKFRYQYSY